MHYTFKDALGGQFNLIKNDVSLNQIIKKYKNKETLFIVWNTGEQQNISIDGISYPFPAYAIIPLMANQIFHIENPSSIVAWTFNREFYCILDHDKEISCSGFLFYGVHPTLFIHIDPEQHIKFVLLRDNFIKELCFNDSVQEKMLKS